MEGVDGQQQVQEQQPTAAHPTEVGESQLQQAQTAAVGAPSQQQQAARAVNLPGQSVLPPATMGAMLPPGQVLPPGVLAGAGMMPMMPLISDFNTLSQMTKIPVEVLKTNPQVFIGAQQFVATQSALMRMQLMGIRPMLPTQLPAVQTQRPLNAIPGTAARGGKAKSTSSSKARKTKAPAVATVSPKPPPEPSARVNPGGKVIWAKNGNNPWWPAKTLEEGKDLSFPANEEPPRPTSIAIRFFGSHEFAWLGSKRQMTDWDQGKEFRNGSKQDIFKAAIEEAEQYLATESLPDTFYQTPVSEAPRRQPRKRGSRNKYGMDGVSDMVFGSGGTKSRLGGKEGPQDRASLVHERKKQRLEVLGLLPPADSPYAHGRLAPNEELLSQEDAWEASHPDVMAAAASVAEGLVPSSPRARKKPLPPVKELEETTEKGVNNDPGSLITPNEPQQSAMLEFVPGMAMPQLSAGRMMNPLPTGHLPSLNQQQGQQQQ